MDKVTVLPNHNSTPNILELKEEINYNDQNPSIFRQLDIHIYIYISDILNILTY